MIKQEWVDKEEIKIDREVKSKRKFNETLDFIRAIFLLMTVFFYTSALSSDEIALDMSAVDVSTFVLDDQHIYANDGIWFMCNVCRTCQWQADWKANWRGEFFCVRCGEKFK